MEENTSNLSTSPYMFRPILEPSTPLTDESLTRSYYSHTSLHTSSTPHLADRLSVMDRNCSSRIRVSSGGSVNPLDVSNVGNFRPQAISSPTVSSGCVDGITKRPPKLYNCWRTNPESWSSTGSRHSSRPGSSQASSRPPSQCNNVLQQLQGQHSNTTIPTTISNLYSKSNNNSNSDVSSAQKNFQKLSVSSRINAECRRAAFKSQKWSNSFDQTCVAASSPSSASTASQASPGRRRQSSLQQATQHQHCSLDLPDSGYSGASSVDLGKSWYSQNSWDPTSQLNTNNSQQQQQLAVGNAQLLKQFSNASSNICVSPIETAKQELEELKSEFGDVFSANISANTSSNVANSSLRKTVLNQSMNQEDVNKDEEIARRSASLPSFPDSFIPGIAGRNVNLNNSFNAQLQHHASQDVNCGDSMNIPSIINSDINYSNNVLIVDEPLDVLDKEIEMIMAPQQKTPTTSEVLNFLEEYEEDPLNDHFEGLGTLDEKSILSSSKVPSRNPFFLRRPPLSRDNSGGSSGEYNKIQASMVPTTTIITVTSSQEPSQLKSKMNYLAPPTSQTSQNTLGAHWPYNNKNNKRSLFARKLGQQRASFNNDESSPQTRPPSLKAFHHSLDDGGGILHHPQKKPLFASHKKETANNHESSIIPSMNSSSSNTLSTTSASSVMVTSTSGSTIMTGDIVTQCRPNFDPRSQNPEIIEINTCGSSSTSSCSNSISSNTVISTSPQRITSIDGYGKLQAGTNNNAKMHLDSAMISSSSLGNSYYPQTFLGVDSALSPDHMTSCSPSLISPYTSSLQHSTVVNSPVSPPVMSPSNNAFITNDIMDTKVFQFPPPNHLHSNTCMPSILPPTSHQQPTETNQTLNVIKQEEWSIPCLQDNLPNQSNMHHEERSMNQQANNDGLQQLCFPAVATSSNTLHQPDLGSPMAISPASLNTPRGSITSFRSRSQQNSPMNMDSILNTYTSLAATSSGSAQTSVSSSCTTTCATTATLSSNSQMDMLNEINASFTIQVPTTISSTPMNNTNAIQDQNMISAFHGNENAFNNGGESNQYISYTMLQPSLTENTQLDQNHLQHKFPSPPGSPVQHMANYSHPNFQQNMTSMHNVHPPPPSYEEFMSGGMVLTNDNSIAHHQLSQQNTVANSVDILSSNEVHNFFNDGVLKTEPDLEIPQIMQPRAGVDTNKGKTNVHDHDSLFTSDTCPETPDSSVKEDTDVNSPDSGNYVCLWQDCNEEFDNPKTFVDHVNEAHMETRKGCEEFPCLWKDCPRAFKAFNAKYKLITHMRVHTKEKPYRCTYENCTRAFARSENRKIHVRSHTGQKPFSCKYAVEFNCTKKFSNSSDRAKHEQTHKDPKPYKCEVVGCTKRYTDPSSLRKHVKGHSQEEQLQYRRSKDLANLAKRSASPTNRYANWVMDTNTCSPPSVASTCGSVGLSVSGNGGSVLPNSASSPSSSNGIVVSTNIPAYTTNGISSSCNISNTQQMNILQAGTGLNTSGGTVQLVTTMETANSQREEFVGNSTSNNSATNLPPNVRAFRGGRLTHQPNSLDDLDETDTIPFDTVPVRYDTTGMFDLATNWSEPSSTTNPEMNQM